MSWIVSLCQSFRLILIFMKCCSAGAFSQKWDLTFFHFSNSKSVMRSTVIRCCSVRELFAPGAISMCDSITERKQAAADGKEQ